ncbi:hypothetical protein ACFQ0O_19395 [Saccharopolyspora spinosporotrichia]
MRDDVPVAPRRRDPLLLALAGLPAASRAMPAAPRSSGSRLPMP